MVRLFSRTVFQVNRLVFGAGLQLAAVASFAFSAASFPLGCALGVLVSHPPLAGTQLETIKWDYIGQPGYLPASADFFD